VAELSGLEVGVFEAVPLVPKVDGVKRFTFNVVEVVSDGL
jgi:hypothetical protein